MLELSLLLQVCVVYALPSFIPAPTLLSDVRVVAPKPTAPPERRPDLARRDIASNTCGWVGGKSDDPFYCVGAAATCLWNDTNKFVGCGNAETLHFVTSCIEFESASNCDSACSANPSVSVCPSDMPYCASVLFPNSFSMIPCWNTQKTRNVDLTFDGQTTTVNLPRSLLANNLVAFGTTIPSSVITSTSTSASPTPTHFSDQGGKVDNGSIIAAAIGGGVLLLGLPFGIKMFLRRRKWKKAQRPRRLQEREMRRQWAEVGNPYAVQEIPAEPTGGGHNFLFSQDWHDGRTKTGAGGSGTTPEVQGNQ